MRYDFDTYETSGSSLKPNLNPLIGRSKEVEMFVRLLLGTIMKSPPPQDDAEHVEDGNYAHNFESIDSTVFPASMYLSRYEISNNLFGKYPHKIGLSLTTGSVWATYFIGMSTNHRAPIPYFNHVRILQPSSFVEDTSS